MIAHKGLLPALAMLTEDENSTVCELAQFVVNTLAGKTTYWTCFYELLCCSIRDLT